LSKDPYHNIRYKYCLTGVACIINNDEKILLGKRINKSHGSGEFWVPGGKIDYGESPIESIVREVKEEAGITIEKPQFVDYSFDFFEDAGLQFVCLWFQAPYQGDKIVACPKEFEYLKWFSINNLPEKTCPALKKILN